MVAEGIVVIDEQVPLSASCHSETCSNRGESRCSSMSDLVRLRLGVWQISRITDIQRVSIDVVVLLRDDASQSPYSVVYSAAIIHWHFCPSRCVAPTQPRHFLVNRSRFYCRSFFLGAIACLFKIQPRASTEQSSFLNIQL